MGNFKIHLQRSTLQSRERAEIKLIISGCNIAEVCRKSDHYSNGLQGPQRLSDLTLRRQGTPFGWCIKRSRQSSTIEGEWNSRLTARQNWDKWRVQGGVGSLSPWPIVAQGHPYRPSLKVGCGVLQPMEKEWANLFPAPPCTGNSLKCHIKMDLI